MTKMEKDHILLDIVKKQKEGLDIGIFSVCSSNKYVIEACMRKAKVENSSLLIEPTANQVNRYGGYSGMKPNEFVEYIKALAYRNGFDFNKIILGGDHLGPLPWANEKADSAMRKAEEVVRDFVLSGFSKIHIDTTTKLQDDDIFNPEIIAKRGAALVKVAEEAFKELKKKDNSAIQPVYIIGSEVPVAGGVSMNSDDDLNTDPDSFKETVKSFKDSFKKLNLSWDNVVGVVVHPGVEFGNDFIHVYDKEKNEKLSVSLKEYNNIVFEGHSTDYQSSDKLKEMVEDGIAILKVGPALTFALRELLFSLSMIEKELHLNDEYSNFIETLDKAMVRNPKHWEKHYSGNNISLLRKYSFLDRTRYYMEDLEVSKAINLLIHNIETSDIPFALILQYLPEFSNDIKMNKIKLNFNDLLDSKISKILDNYYYATSPKSLYKHSSIPSKVNLKC